MSLEKDFKKEHNKLDYKYEQLYKPFYERRQKIIEGEEKPDFEKIREKLAELKINEEEAKKEKEDEKGIPEFWYKVLLNNQDIMLNERDKDVLKKLKLIKCTPEENGNFSLEFFFEPNDYFTNEVLKREFILDEDCDIKEIKSDEIQWKSDAMNTTIEIKQKKVKNKRTKQVKTITKKEKREDEEGEEIITKYDQIYENISTPMKNNSEKLMISLALQDAELLRENYKSIDKLKSITKILDKDKLLKNFEPINKKIRNNDNVTSDNFYDKILNDCIIETAIEIINKERLYGKNGEPLKWSSRTHELAFKYRKDDPYKLADYVCEKLDFFIKRKVGLISDNYDEMSIEQINMEKDKRLTNIIQRELDENEYQWINLEMEETQLKVDNTEQIMEQLYNEVIEILEHIQYSRLNPELYQNKSIYSCEEIPKLHFQITTTEDAAGADGNDNNNSDNKNNL